MLCTVLKDPHLRYIDEWADYHYALGFSHIRLYDNTDKFVLEEWGWDKPYANQIDRIHYLPSVTHTIIKQGGAPNQSTAFMDCAYSAKEEGYDWVAGLDIDEFLVIRDTNMSVVDLMEQYCHPPCGELAFTWLIFGPSNQTTYAPIPVTKRFTEKIHGSEWDNHVKGIANPHTIDFTSYWMHTWNLLPPNQRQDTNGKELNWRNLKYWSMMLNTRKPHDVASIHHYKTLSEEEWHEKTCKRKSINGNNRKGHCKTTAEDSVLNKQGRKSRDEDGWTRLRNMVPEYRVYDILEE